MKQRNEVNLLRKEIEIFGEVEGEFWLFLSCFYYWQTSDYFLKHVLIQRINIYINDDFTKNEIINLYFTKHETKTKRV